MMRYDIKSGRKSVTNNVNICVNVNKNCFENIEYFQNQITSLSSELNSLKENVLDLATVEEFEEKLNQFFDLTEREKIKSLIGEQSYEKIRNYIIKYEDFNSLIEEGKKLSCKETEICLNESIDNVELSSTIISGQVDGESVILNDNTNIDNDFDTDFKIPVNGIIVGIEIYCSENLGSRRESWEGIKTSYDSSSKKSYILLDKENYNIVYNRAPNNKMKIYSLIIE